MTIPIWYQKFLTETITYWSPASHDHWGKEVFATPVTISGRWEDRAERFATALGEEAISNAKVYLASQVTIAGWLLNGASTASDPATVSGAYPVRRVERIPSLREDEFIYKALL